VGTRGNTGKAAGRTNTGITKKNWYKRLITFEEGRHQNSFARGGKKKKEIAKNLSWGEKSYRRPTKNRSFRDLRARIRTLSRSEKGHLKKKEEQDPESKPCRIEKELGLGGETLKKITFCKKTPSRGDWEAKRDADFPNGDLI